MAYICFYPEVAQNQFSTQNNVPSTIQDFLLVCNFSGNTHDIMPWYQVHGSRRVLFDQWFTASKKAVLTFLLCCQCSSPEGLGGSQGEGEFCFHDSSIPGLQRRQPASGQSVAIVMGSRWCGCLNHQRISQEPFKSASSSGVGPEAVCKPEKSHLCFLPNPDLNNLPLCYLF